MIRVAPAYAHMLPQLFSVECWGGATFDVAYRFLQECPWQRLRDLRAAMPNLMTQMLLRASNGVGYTNYPDNVVQTFVAQAAKSGVDVFRVFDPLNWVENMRVALDAVIDSGKLCEAAVCYTGDLADPARVEVRPEVLRRHGEGAERRRRARPRHQGHGRAPEALGRLHARQDAQGGGRPADPLPHPRHQRHRRRQHPRGLARRGRRRRRGDGQPLGQHLAALPRLDRRGAGAHRARHRARHRGDPPDLGLLGGGADAVRRLRGRAEGAGLGGLPARDAGRAVHQPQGAGALDGARGALARGRAHVRRGEPDVRRHREGDADLEGRRRHGADDGGAGPDPRRRSRIRRSRSPSPRASST